MNQNLLTKVICIGRTWLSTRTITSSTRRKPKTPQGTLASLLLVKCSMVSFVKYSSKTVLPTKSSSFDKEVLPANRNYNLSGSAAHDHDTEERTEFESEIELLRCKLPPLVPFWFALIMATVGYEGKHNANCGRRIVRVATFLADYGEPSNMGSV